ncbi:MAG: hypothetical protein KY469_11500 [Actinobacteria bacterium]|nr:hypothetical protein [Actinomycetota bacterium]
MNRTENPEAADEAFEAHEWSRACEHLEAAEGRAALDHRDLARLATVRYLLGRELDSIDTWARASRLAHEQQDHVRAARCCLWAGSYR